MVPREFYDSLLSKTSVDDYADQLLNDTLTDNRTNNSTKHTMLNQRLQGYLDHYKREKNKPVKVFLENGEQAFAHKSKPKAVRGHKEKATQSAQAETTQAGDDTKFTIESTDNSLYDDMQMPIDIVDAKSTVQKILRNPSAIGKTPKKEPSSKNSLKPPKSLDNGGFIPGDKFSFTPVSHSQKSAPVTPIQQLRQTITDIEGGSTNSPQAIWKKQKAEAAETLLGMINSDRKKFGVDGSDRVLSSAGVPINGSNVRKIIYKYRDGTLKNLNGDKVLLKHLGKIPEAGPLTGILFGTSPPRTRKGSRTQMGKGLKTGLKNRLLFSPKKSTTNSNKSNRRFTVRDWRV